jgi:multiple sugar transport system ATP-binding protein
VGDRPKATIPLPPQPDAISAYAGKEIIAGVRAEDIAHGPPEGPAHRSLDATVEVTEPTGADVLTIVSVGGQELTARLDPDIDLRPGEKPPLHVDLAKLVCFDPKTEQRIV